MTAPLLRVGEFLVGLAARRLPAAAKDERRREWEAELPVILGDLEVKSAMARSARMLWFAADTMRGAVRRPGPGRHPGAHRGGARKNARALGVLAVALTGMAVLLAGMAVLLAGLAFMVYQISVGVDLAYYATFLLTSLITLAAVLSPPRSGGSIWYWFSAGMVAAAAGQFARALAGYLGWGHPLLFMLVGDGGFAIFAVCLSAGAAVVGSQARRRRRDTAAGQRR